VVPSDNHIDNEFPEDSVCELPLDSVLPPETADCCSSGPLPPPTRFGCALLDRRKGGNTSESGKGWGSGTELNYLSICHSLYGFTDTLAPFQ
jgi:hypothetical protein